MTSRQLRERCAEHAIHSFFPTLRNLVQGKLVKSLPDGTEIAYPLELQYIKHDNLEVPREIIAAIERRFGVKLDY